MSALTDEQWSGLGYHDVAELMGGRQSRAFSVRAGVETLVVKLAQGDLVDKHVLERKTAMVAALAQLDSSVVAPVRVCGSLVHELSGWLITASSYVEGEHPDQSIAADGAVLGASLAGLHRSMRQLEAVPLPRVAALTTDLAGRWTSSASDQLLHGDFAASNVIVSPDGVRVVDFDDCGYGPIEFDIANALYMEMFDTWVNERPQGQYADFRAVFTSSYAEVAGSEIAASDIDSLIRLRVMALERWTDDPSEAPIGIQNSPPDWIETLHRFIGDWDSWGDE